jgi:hypothetical protein
MDLFQPIISGSLTVSGSVIISGSLSSTQGFTGSFSGIATSASYAETASLAQTASFVNTAQTASYFITSSVTNATSASLAQTASFVVTAQTASSIANLNQNVQITGSLTTSGTLTAQTLVVQTVTSSIVYSSGSNIFGNQLTDIQQMTGSLRVTGSLQVTGSATFSSNANINGEVLTIGGTSNNAIINNIASVRINIDSNNNDTGESFTVGNNQTGIDNNNVLFRVQENGNVGISTTTPSYALDVYAASGYTARFNGLTYGGLLLASGSTTNTYVVGESTLLSIEHIEAINLRTNNADRVRILSNGNVGIATTAPDARLTVVGPTGTASGYGNFLVKNTSEAGISFGASGTSYTWIQGNVYGSGAAIIAINPSGGNVGVGLTGVYSDVKFMTRGASATSADYSFRAENSAGSNIIYCRNDGLISTGTQTSSPYNNSVTGRIVYVNSSGELGYLSSIRESKININPINNSDIINKLNPVSFNYRNKDENNQYTNEFDENIFYGLIADEVEKIDSNLVFYDKKEDGTKELKGVYYEKLAPLLIKAIQELKAEIEELKNK